MKIKKPSFRLSSAALLLWPLAAPGLLSPLVTASELQGLGAAVVGATNRAKAEERVEEIAEQSSEELSQEFSDDMLDFILSSDIETLQAIEHRPLLEMLDDGATSGAGQQLLDVNLGGPAGASNKTGQRVSWANGVKAADKHYE